MSDGVKLGAGGMLGQEILEACGLPPADQVPNGASMGVITFKSVRKAVLVPTSDVKTKTEAGRFKFDF